MDIQKMLHEEPSLACVPNIGDSLERLPSPQCRKSRMWELTQHLNTDNKQCCSETRWCYFEEQ